MTTDAFTISLDCRQDATTERSITPGKRIKHQDTSIDRVGRHQGTFGLAALAITAAALETLHSAADAGPISWWSQPDDLALHRKRREGDMSRINPLDGGVFAGFDVRILDSSWPEPRAVFDIHR